MIELQLHNRRRIVLFFLSGLLLCASVHALTADLIPPAQPGISQTFFDESGSTLLADAQSSPGKDSNGNAYAYGRDKDKPTETPTQNPTGGTTPTPVPTLTPSSTPTATPTLSLTATPLPSPTAIPTKEPATVLPTRVSETAAPVSPVSVQPPKAVPLSGIIPDEALPAAAAGSAIALTGLFALFQSAVSSWGGQITTLLKNVAGGFITGKILDRDKEKRTIRQDVMEKLYLGFSRPELLVLLASTLIIGILFLFADRQPFEPVMIVIYVVMGGFGLVIHELAHLHFEHRFSCRTEIQFWGIGTLIMAITAWLFGNVFAQPFLTLVHTKEPLEKGTIGRMMLAGPAVSLALAFLCLLLMPMGGLLRTAGQIGFLMNMVTAVFELLPIPPCEGKEIFAWNKLVWAAAFVPLFGIYLFMTM